MNRQLASLPSGTILVPMMPQNNRVNNANTQEETKEENETSQQSTTEQGPEDNRTRALNFLQLANGNYVVRNTTFKVSDKVSDKMSV